MLLNMSIQGGVLIAVITLIRMLLKERLPKNTFMILWGIVLLRLLIPFSLPSVTSIYSVLNNSRVMENIEDRAHVSLNTILSGNHNKVSDYNDTKADNMGAQYSLNAFSDNNSKGLLKNYSFLEWTVKEQLSAIWLFGFIFLLILFSLSYLKLYREFQSSLPIENDIAAGWLCGRRSKRNIKIRQSDLIASPLTYGILKPVILMPKKTDWENKEQLKYVLMHEYTHIKRFDALTKLILISALCIHWFNPFVWVMYILFNRDIELSCDELVVKAFGDDTKAEYAMTLISMEEKRSGTAAICSFSKNAIEERISSVMKIRKHSIITIFTAVFIVIGISAVFATSAKGEGKLKAIPDTEFSNEEYEMLAALKPDGYKNMTISEFQQKIWNIRDTKEYAELLEQFSQSAEFNDLKDTNETAEYFFYILEPITAEKWQTRDFGGYTSTDFEASDNAQLEYQISISILEPDSLTVGEYNNVRKSASDILQGCLRDRSKEELENEREMSSYIDGMLEDMYKKLCSDKIQVSVTYKFMPLMQYDENTEMADTENKDLEERANERGTKKDYDSLLKLKTPNYKNMTVADFNMRLLDWANEDYYRNDRINTDISWNDFPDDLSDDERTFVTTAVLASGIENAEYVKSSYTGEEEKDPNIGAYDLIKDERGMYCRLYFEIFYHIPDKNKLTVGERDNSIFGALNEIQAFWDNTAVNELIKTNKEQIVSMLEDIGAKYSSDKISIYFDAERIGFECMDERDIIEEREEPGNL